MKDPRAPIRFLKNHLCLLCLQATEQISLILLGPGTVIHLDCLLLTLLMKILLPKVVQRKKKIENFSTVQKKMNNMNFAVQL